VICPEATSTHEWRDNFVGYLRQQYGFGYGRLDLVAKHRRRLTGDDVSRVEMMLHADHTYDKHPWYGPLTRGERRGLGAELRVFGLDPDAVEQRARARGAKVVQPATTKGHGWREVMVEDPDGYLWAVGVPTPSPRGS